MTTAERLSMCLSRAMCRLAQAFSDRLKDAPRAFSENRGIEPRKVTSLSDHPLYRVTDFSDGW